MRQGSDKAAIGKAAGALAVFLLAFAQPARAADELPYAPMPEAEIAVPEVEVDVGRIDIAPPPRLYPAPRGAYGAIPPMRHGGMIERPTVPPHRIATMLRATGFSLLGRIEQRGWIYTVAVLDPNGDDGRAIIDARTGAMIKFIPAQAVTARLKDELAMVYGPPGPPPMRDLRHAPRPPLNVPRVASRTPAATPLPRARQGAVPAQQAAKPGTQHAAIKPKPAVVPETAAPAATAAAPATQSAPQPPEIELKPTQEMPPVQTLE
ncbi:MAG: hypothetical protein J0G28_13375 [Afipia sp.]|nr:hypothetical protein [Afipia sp.]OJW61421.1 MAG: hypothetical protein BGO65_10390 [Afipia sp. 64-13]